MKNKSLDDNPSDLGEMESEEEFVFPPNQRRLITQPVDLSVQTLSEQWDAEHLYLPSIQREYVWDNGKASRLIESLILNIPIPVLYFAETAEARFEIIDGHQRVRSIVRYLTNEFALSGLAVLSEYNGLRFHQLPDREQRFLKMRTLRAVIISVDSHPNMKFEIFERLNTGAISLNAQELRNSIYRGPFNELLHELSREPIFRQLIGSKLPRRRMVDEELILKFFALQTRLDQYRPPLKRFLNDYIATVQHSSEDALANFRQLFSRTTRNVQEVIGESAFRVIDPDGGVAEPFVNRALFDAQMIACSWIAAVPANMDIRRVRRNVAALFADEDFMDSIQRATGDRSRTFRRVSAMAMALIQSGIELDVPFDLTQ